jgi:mono/diheme cytochrome c family protein
MKNALHKIAPRHLQPGMFIEELDRPWLETPLKFQSFYIRSLDQVKWIRANCSYVMVDRGKSDAALVFDAPDSSASEPMAKESELLLDCMAQMNLPDPGQPVAAPSSAPPQGSVMSNAVPLRMRLASWLGRRQATPASPSLQIRDFHTGQEQIRHQLARAEHTYRQAHKVMSGVLNELRVGGELDVPAVEKVIYPVIDCVLQSTDAMACVLRMKETDDYLYNHALAGVVLCLVMLGGVLIRHTFNLRHKGKPGWPFFVAGSALLLVAAFIVRPEPAQAAAAGTPAADPARALAIVHARCTPCHAEKPSFAGIVAPPGGILLQTADDLDRLADRVHQQSVVLRAMPLGNLTNLTDAERAELASWYAGRNGAK